MNEYDIMILTICIKIINISEINNPDTSAKVSSRIPSARLTPGKILQIYLDAVYRTHINFVINSTLRNVTGSQSSARQLL